MTRVAAVVTALVASVATPGAVRAVEAGTTIRGTVLSPEGLPLALATVTLTPQQPFEVSDTHAIGDVYVEEPVATATTDPQGRFAVALPHVEQRLVDYAALNDGILNMWVQATLGLLDQDLTSQPPGEVVGRAKQPVWSGTDIVYVAVDADGTVEPVTGSTGEARGNIDAVQLEMLASGYADAVTGSAVGTDAPCEWAQSRTTVIARDTKMDAFAQVHNGEDMTSTLEYGQHANTDLTGAVNVGGHPWKATAGYTHVGNKGTTITGTWPANEGWTVLTRFRWIQERWELVDANTHRVCYWEHRIRTEGWTGDSIGNGNDRYRESTWDDLIKAKENSHLAYFDPGSSWKKHTATTHTFTAEVTAFKVTSLKAKSEWSEQVDLTYKFGQSRDRKHYLYYPTKDIADAPAVYAW
jgi:hypothetical protein